MIDVTIFLWPLEGNLIPEMSDFGIGRRKTFLSDISWITLNATENSQTQDLLLAGYYAQAAGFEVEDSIQREMK